MPGARLLVLRFDSRISRGKNVNGSDAILMLLISLTSVRWFPMCMSLTFRKSDFSSDSASTRTTTHFQSVRSFDNKFELCLATDNAVFLVHNAVKLISTQLDDRLR